MVWKTVFTKSCSMNCDHWTSATLRSSSTTPSYVAFCSLIKLMSGRVSSKNVLLIFFGDAKSTIYAPPKWGAKKTKTNKSVNKIVRMYNNVIMQLSHDSTKQRKQRNRNQQVTAVIKKFQKNKKQLRVLLTIHPHNWLAADGDTNVYRLWHPLLLHIGPIDRRSVARMWKLLQHTLYRQYQPCRNWKTKTNQTKTIAHTKLK